MMAGAALHCCVLMKHTVCHSGVSILDLRTCASVRKSGITSKSNWLFVNAMKVHNAKGCIGINCNCDSICSSKLAPCFSVSILYIRMTLHLTLVCQAMGYGLRLQRDPICNYVRPACQHTKKNKTYSYI